MNEAPLHAKTFPVTWDELHRHARALAWRLLELGPWQRHRRGDARRAGAGGDRRARAGHPARRYGLHRQLRRSHAGRGRGAESRSPATARAFSSSTIWSIPATPRGRCARCCPRRISPPSMPSPRAGRWSTPIVTEVSQDTWILFPWDIEPQFAPPIASARAAADEGPGARRSRRSWRCAPAAARPQLRHDMVESADPRAAAIGRDILRQGGSAADAAVGDGGGADHRRAAIGRHRRRRVPGALVGARPCAGGARRARDARRLRRGPTGSSTRTASRCRSSTRCRRALGRRAGAAAAARGGAPALRQAALGQPHRAFDQARARRAIALSPRRARHARQRPLSSPKTEAARALYYAGRRQRQAGGHGDRQPGARRDLARHRQRGRRRLLTGAIAHDIADAVGRRHAHGRPHRGGSRVLRGEGARGGMRALSRPSRVRHGIAVGRGADAGNPAPDRAVRPRPSRRRRASLAPFRQASRLAYADRGALAGRPGFRPGAGRGAARSRLHRRRAPSSSIPRKRAPGPAAPGDPPGKRSDLWGDGRAPEFPSTSNISVIDGDGDAVAMTATIEIEFRQRT